MNVHITSTPDFPENHLDEIISLLNETPGEINFMKSAVWDHVKFSVLDDRFEDKNSISSLSFDEYFKLIGKYRRIEEINNDEFVILISKIKNNKNWFSAFNKKDIFVHGDGWDKYSDVDSKYGITYQCIENIFQSLIELDIDNYKNEPNIHKESIGCINDFCKKKIEVIYKIRNADICESCVDRALKMNIDGRVLEHISEIIEKIRQQFISKRKFRSLVNPQRVHIDKNWNIKIGDRLFEPPLYLPKLIFVYFLSHPEGVETKHLCEKKDQFYKIYKEIRKPAAEYTIKRLCCEDGKKSPKTFRTYKSKLNKELEKFLGKELAKHYIIQSKTKKHNNYTYRINLEQDFTKIDPIL